MEWLTYALVIYVESVAALILVGFSLYVVGPYLLPARFPAASNRQMVKEFTLSCLNLTAWAAAAVAITVVNRTIQPPREVPWLYYPLWFLFMLLMVDAMFYWSHRLMHEPRLFRLAHRVHHQFTEPTPGSAYSFHYFEGVVLAITTVFIPYVILPLSPYCGLAFNLFAASWAAFLHSGYDSTGWSAHPLLRYVYSPSHHRHHHQTGQGGYGLYFMFWDRFFGTEADPGANRG